MEFSEVKSSYTFNFKISKMENKKFLIKLVLIFFLIVILLIFIINLIYFNSILPKKNFYKKELIYQDYINNLSKKEIEYAFFGDSHAFHAINPRFIPNSFNFASGAENYIKTYYKLDKIINKDQVTIDNVILEIDLQTFSSIFTEEPFLFNELELYSQFVPLKDISEIRKDSLIQIWIESNFPFLGRGKEFGVLVKDIEFTELDLGWLKNNGNLSAVNETEVSISNYKTTYVGYERISNLSLDYFVKTLNLAKENNITIIFIKYPYSKGYDEVLKQNNITSEDYYNIIFKKINATIDNYYILDYHDAFFDNKEYFGDPEHTNYLGAEILSKEVYMDLENLNISSRLLENNLIKINTPSPRNYSFLIVSLIFLELFLILLSLKLLRKDLINKS